MLKLIAGSSVFGFIAVLNDWNKFAGWSAAERAFGIFVWAFAFFWGQAFVIKLPQKHRLYGWLLFAIAIVCFLGTSVVLATGHQQDAWRWLARAILAGFGFLVLILDQDVRRYRAECIRTQNQTVADEAR